MNKLKRIINYFTITEIILWIVSFTLLTLSFFIFDGKDVVSYISSVVGVTSIIFLAKGNVIGHILMIAFGVFYTIISYTMTYYGEMVICLGMSLPMSILAVFSWVKNPFNNKKVEVKINNIKLKECIFMIFLAIIVTTIFYFILSCLNTANIIFSTLSIATSFTATYLSYRRSEYFALAYTLNDVVLIVLWVLATIQNVAYLSVATCFSVFLANDLYSFINWKKMKKRQQIDIQ